MERQHLISYTFFFSWNTVGCCMMMCCAVSCNYTGEKQLFLYSLMQNCIKLWFIYFAGMAKKLTSLHSSND